MSLQLRKYAVTAFNNSKWNSQIRWTNFNEGRKILLSRTATRGTSQHVSRKHFFTFSKRKKFIPTHSRDGVPKDFDLVFENSLTNVLGPCRIASSLIGVSTILSSVGCLVYYWSSLPISDLIGLTAVTIVTIPTVIVVNILSKRYLLRIYFHEKKNIFMGINQNFFGSLNKIEYSPKDVNIIMSSLKTDKRYDKSNVEIFGQKFHLKANDFIIPKYFNMHTGYIKED